jgi:hypothetical protein
MNRLAIDQIDLVCAVIVSACHKLVLLKEHVIANCEQFGSEMDFGHKLADVVELARVNNKIEHEE